MQTAPRVSGTARAGNKGTVASHDFNYTDSLGHTTHLSYEVCSNCDFSCLLRVLNFLCAVKAELKSDVTFLDQEYDMPVAKVSDQFNLVCWCLHSFITAVTP